VNPIPEVQAKQRDAAVPGPADEPTITIKPWRFVRAICAALLAKGSALLAAKLIPIIGTASLKVEGVEIPVQTAIFFAAIGIIMEAGGWLRRRYPKAWIPL
jgi:hypothetical protein